MPPSALSPAPPPRISILIPTWNRAALLKEALESALAQTYANLEIIVSDNASTDGTPELMARYAGDPRLRCHRNAENIGMAPNWRLACRELATGDFFLLLSDDDLLIDPGYIAKAARLLQEHPEVVLVYADGYILDAAAGTRKELRLPFEGVVPGWAVLAARDQVRPQDFTLCNVLFHRTLALERNAFSDPLNLCCDSELFLCLCVLGHVGVIREFVSQYRIHGGNLLRSVQADPDLLAHTLNMYVVPYRLALEKGTVPRRELAAFERCVRRAIRSRLLLMHRFHPDRFPAFLASTREAFPALTRRALWHPRTMRKMAVAWCRRGLTGGERAP